jgi:small subunit ribosomal protein S17
MKPNKAKTLTGVIVSKKNKQTIIVKVESMFRHPLYKKATRRTKRFAVHNTTVNCAEGDTVLIAEIKPVSKTKHFIVTKVIATKKI